MHAINLMHNFSLLVKQEKYYIYIQAKTSNKPEESKDYIFWGFLSLVIYMFWTSDNFTPLKVSFSLKN